MNILYFDFHNLLAILLIRDIYIILEDQIILKKLPMIKGELEKVWSISKFK